MRTLLTLLMFCGLAHCQMQMITNDIHQSSGPGGGSFVFKQIIVGSNSGTGVSSATITPTGAGHLFVVDAAAGATNPGVPSALTCTDGTHTYSKSLTAGFVTFATAGDHGNGAMLYLLSAPSGASTVTCTWTSANGFVFSQTTILDFTYTGTIALDSVSATAVCSFPTNTGATPITCPSVTPANTGSLLVGAWVTDAGAGNGATSPWTAPASANDSDAYILSSSAGATAANFKDTVNPDSYSSIVAVFH